MALSTFLVTIILAVIAVIGTLLSFMARRYDIQGLEIWLPLAVILSYGISPLAGLIVAALIIIASFIMFPYQLHYVVIMIACVAGLTFSTVLFPVTEANFVTTAIWLTIAYNVLSNLIMAFTGGNIANLFKFAILSIFISWFIYLKAGWYVISLLV